MLGRERALLLEAVRGLARRVVERFLRRDHSIFIDVGRAVGERVRPVFGEARRVALHAALGRGDQRAAVGRPGLQHGAARARRVHDQLRARGHGREQRRELVAVDIGTGQVELVGFAVVAAVADEEQRERVGRLRLGGDCRETLLERLARRALALQHSDARLARRAFRDGGERGDLLVELLLVFLLAAEAADDHEVQLRVGGRADCAQHHRKPEPAQPARGCFRRHSGPHHRRPQ